MLQQTLYSTDVTTVPESKDTYRVPVSDQGEILTCHLRPLHDCQMTIKAEHTTTNRNQTPTTSGTKPVRMIVVSWAGTGLEPTVLSARGVSGV